MIKTSSSSSLCSLPAWISLTLSHHLSLSSIVPGRYLQSTSCIGTELLHVGSSWSFYLCLSMWRGPQEIAERLNMIKRENGTCTYGLPSRFPERPHIKFCESILVFFFFFFFQLYVPTDDFEPAKLRQILTQTKHCQSLWLTWMSWCGTAGWKCLHIWLLRLLSEKQSFPHISLLT